MSADVTSTVDTSVSIKQKVSDKTKEVWTKYKGWIIGGVSVIIVGIVIAISMKRGNLKGAQ